MSGDRTAGRHAARLEALGVAARARLSSAHGAREAGLRASRQMIQLASRSIRATHRSDYAQAKELWQEAGAVLGEARKALDQFPDLRHAGFMRDAEKEYAEAAITLALVSDTELPSADDLGTGQAAYLNGLAEAASELRRSALDALRRGDPARADQLLDLMDEVFSVLETVDFPDAITGGLRRTMDQLRAVVERTRGDVTEALRQAALERRLASLSESLEQRLGAG